MLVSVSTIALCVLIVVGALTFAYRRYQRTMQDSRAASARREATLLAGAGLPVHDSVRRPTHLPTPAPPSPPTRPAARTAPSPSRSDLAACLVDTSVKASAASFVAQPVSPPEPQCGRPVEARRDAVDAVAADMAARLRAAADAVEAAAAGPGSLAGRAADVVAEVTRALGSLPLCEVVAAAAD